MAGIGFELRRVISRGGISNVFNAALSGTLIVAGPWLLTILTIFVIRQYYSLFGLANEGLFQAAIVYCYAFSLSIFSGVHYLFTRLTADLLWENKQGQASGWLIRFSLATALAAALIAGILLSFLPLDSLENPLLFKFGIVFLFVAVNLLWLVMLFISLLKQYVKIMLVYLAGMALAVALVVWWGHVAGVGGALSGFAFGHLAIVLALSFMSFLAHPAEKLVEVWATLNLYIKKYSLLVLSGLFFYLSQWADKFFFWFSRGQSIENSFFRLFDSYDLPVYLAGLSIIPGIFYFVVFAETSFYRSLQHFLHVLVKEPYSQIQKAKYDMIRVMQAELRDQMVFQAIFSVLATVLAIWFIENMQIKINTIISLLAMFFQLVLMTLINFLYYFEQYKRAFVASLVFFGINAGIMPVFYLLLPNLAPGLGFLCATAGASLVAWLLLFEAAKTMERRIFLKALL